jgi:serine/threonine protein kinase
VSANPRRRFRFLRELAEGGFGKVYLAEMLTGDDFSTVVAIKLLHGRWSDHDEIVMRSRDEARLLGRLRHRNIVRVEDLTSINGQCAVIMEYLEGVDLKTLVAHLSELGERMPIRATFEVTAFIAGALSAAYNHIPLQGSEPLHLIHRDIKPSNVMVTAAAEVKLLDFGTARANFETREAKTQALAFGSQAYMAPERMLGDPDTPAADIFSLGITLYELLTGASFGKVFLRPERYERALSERLARIDFSRGLPTELHDEAINVMRLMLHYEPEDRPDAAQVSELMEVLAEDANDMGLRRTCRRYVPDALAAHIHEGSSDDPLTGSTLFEDRSATFTTEGLSPDEIGVGVGGVAVSSGQPLHHDPTEELGDDYEDMDDLYGSMDRAGPPTPPHVESVTPSIPPDNTVGMTGTPIPGTVPPVSEPPPLPEEAPPVVDPVWTPPPVTPTERRAEPGPQSSGGGKKLLLVLLLLIVVGGGAAAALLLGGGTETTTPAGPDPVEPARPDPVEPARPDPVEDPVADPDEDPVEDPDEEPVEDPDEEPVEDPDEGDDGQASADGGQAAALPTGRGGLELVLKPLGAGSVKIYNQAYNYYRVWDGSGSFEAGDLIEGEYVTEMVPNDGGASIWGNVKVTPGQTCKYRLDTQGAKYWQLRTCK